MASRSDRERRLVVVESEKTYPYWRAPSLSIILRRWFDHEQGFIVTCSPAGPTDPISKDPQFVLKVKSNRKLLKVQLLKKASMDEHSKGNFTCSFVKVT